MYIFSYLVKKSVKCINYVDNFTNRSFTKVVTKISYTNIPIGSSNKLRKTKYIKKCQILGLCKLRMKVNTEYLNQTVVILIISDET